LSKAISAAVMSHREQTKARQRGIKDALEREVRELSPGSFALVMATGIVSLAAHLLGPKPVAWLLFYLNLAAYGSLCLLTGARLVQFFPRVAADLTRHARGPAFFATVAGTCILGSQFIVLDGKAIIAFAFWIVGAVLWFILMYAFFAAVIVHETKPSLEEGLHGGWLIPVVATQSVSVLGTLVAPHSGTHLVAFLLYTLAMYLLGCALYILIISLVFYRLLFFTLTPQEFTPAYWVNMGAIAITTLAGATLIQNAPRWGLLREILPFLKGFTLFFWVTSTWWIPLLVILEFWRHLYRRFPIRYNPDYWDIVFPLGMYTTCTFELARTIGLPSLVPVCHLLVYVSLLVWSVVLLGLICRLWSGLTIVFLFERSPNNAR
jgi:tellurite resistance protein TehA-like permease